MSRARNGRKTMTLTLTEPQFRSIQFGLLALVHETRNEFGRVSEREKPIWRAYWKITDQWYRRSEPFDFHSFWQQEKEQRL